jgi:hypothetical protein
MKNERIIFIVLIVLVAAGAFFGGMQYGKAGANNQLNRFNRGTNGRQFGNGNGVSARGQTVVSGDILSSGDNTLTVKLTDGSSKIVILSGNTAISQNATASASDLKNGERVMVIGTQNSDQSVTAQNIQINPQFRGPGQQGAGNGTGAGNGPAGPTGN